MQYMYYNSIHQYVEIICVSIQRSRANNQQQQKSTEIVLFVLVYTIFVKFAIHSIPSESVMHSKHLYGMNWLIRSVKTNGSAKWKLYTHTHIHNPPSNYHLFANSAKYRNIVNRACSEYNGLEHNDIHQKIVCSENVFHFILCLFVDCNNWKRRRDRCDW